MGVGSAAGVSWNALQRLPGPGFKNSVPRTWDFVGASTGPLCYGNSSSPTLFPFILRPTLLCPRMCHRASRPGVRPFHRVELWACQPIGMDRRKNLSTATNWEFWDKESSKGSGMNFYRIWYRTSLVFGVFGLMTFAVLILFLWVTNWISGLLLLDDIF